jgi:exopolysaccharide biosynthesis protein
MESNYGRNVKVRNGGYSMPPSRDGRPGNRGKARKRLLPIGLVIVIDVLLAALLLGIFYIVTYTIKTETKGEPLPGSSAVAQASTPTVSDTASASPDVTVSESTSPGETASAGTSPEVSATGDPSDWRTKFAGKFTSGEVVKTDTSYKSANISIDIQTVMKGDVPCYIADIYVADVKYFKTAFAKQADVMGDREMTDVVAKENDAILAINGDHCVDNEGTVVRNGQLFRKPKSSLDVLVMYNDGSMKAFSPEDFDVDSTLSSGVYQIWTFGPKLLQDGQAMTEFNSTVNKSNPRTAVGYFEPGHYCFVVIGGRQEGYSLGYTMQELSQLMAELKCTEAYNLDGGKSSEMIFLGNMLNEQAGGRRSTTDILYIADK